jgi:hypothetical protein
MMMPGPGATDETRERLEQIARAWQKKMLVEESE